MPQPQPESKLVSPTLDRQGFIRVDGVILGRWIEERGTIQLMDKNRLTVQCRGCQYVEVTIASLLALTKDA